MENIYIELQQNAFRVFFQKFDKFEFETIYLWNFTLFFKKAKPEKISFFVYYIPLLLWIEWPILMLIFLQNHSYQKSVCTHAFLFYKGVYTKGRGERSTLSRFIHQIKVTQNN